MNKNKKYGKMKKTNLILVALLLLGFTTFAQGWGKGMKVYAGTTLTEDSGTTINITGGAGWTLLLEDDLTHSPSAKFSGNVVVDAGSDSVRVQQYLTRDQWHYVAPMVSPSEYHDYWWIYMYKFNENDRTWTNIFNDNSQGWDMGVGYAAYSPSNGGIWPIHGDSVENHGLPLNASIDNLALSYSYSGTSAQKGWNLVGNPFTISLDWNGHADWDLQNVESTIQTWNHDVVGYGTYNWNTGIGTNGMDNVIATGQSFFVHATASGARLDLPASQRIHRPNVEILKEAKTDPENLLRIIASKDGKQNEILIAFDKKTTEGFDPMYDACYLASSGSIADLYVTEGDEIYAQYWSPSIENHEIIPVNFEAHSNGNFVLSFANTEGFDSAIPIWLEDKKNNEWQNLRENNQYAFAATTEDDFARFNVHFATPNDVEEGVNNTSNIYAYEKTVNIFVSEKNFSGTAHIYDLLGQEVIAKNVQSGCNQISMLVNNTYFVVKLVSADKIVTKKVYIH